jgi:putative ABC transport system permease protein
MSLLDDCRTDAVRGARNLLRTPGFTLAAVATLALGIGANSAVFSVVNAVLLRPLPYARPESRVVIWSRWTGFDKTWVSDAEVVDYRTLVRSFAQVAAWDSGQANLTGDGEPVRIGYASVTANTFSTLGAQPLLGRGFTPEEERPGAAVAVLSYGLWQGRYGGDPGLVGRSIQLDGVPRAVVGVMPPGFRLPTDFGEDAVEPTALWVPLALDTSQLERGSHGYYAAAQLASGSGVPEANAELDALAANWTRDGLYPEPMRFRPFVVSVEDEVVGAVRPAMLLVLGAVTFLLLIASANVASLLLARAESRQREIAVRAALGAGHGRLLRQLLAESAVLALPSALVSLGVAWASVRLLGASEAAGIPRAAEASLDGRVLLFTLGVSLLATLVFSLAPALRTLRLNLSESLRDGTRGTVSGRRQRLRGLLVVGEVALSVVLLLGAGLMLRSLWALYRIDVGFEPAGVLALRLALPQSGYDTPEKVVTFYRSLLERVRAIPGVHKAGLIRSLPLAAPIGDWGLQIEGWVDPPGTHAKGDWQVASDGAVEALGERLVRGRAFAETDTADSEQVALVNETMARTYWPGGEALGGRLRMGSSLERPWATVVGVVADVRHNGVTAPIKEKFYRPHSQFHLSTGNASRSMNLVVRAAGDPVALALPIKAAVSGLDPNVPVAAVRRMTDVVGEAVATPRLAGRLLLVFAALALALSAVGLYGLLSYLVGQRQHEIGIRLVIGADASSIRWLVLGQGLRLTVAGVALGSLAALALTRMMSSLLHGVAPNDPATFTVAPLVLLAAALAASYLPARRATTVDPAVILRAE